MVKASLKYATFLLFTLLTIVSYGQRAGRMKNQVTISGYLKPRPAIGNFCVTLRTDNDTFRLAVNASGYFTKTIKNVSSGAHPGMASLEYNEDGCHHTVKYFVLDTNVISLEVNITSGEWTVSGGRENKVEELFNGIGKTYAGKMAAENLTMPGMDSISMQKYLLELALIQQYNGSYIAYQRLKTLFRPSTYGIRDRIRAAIERLDTTRFSPAERTAMLKKFSDYVEESRKRMDGALFPSLQFEATPGGTSFQTLASRYPYLLIDVWATWCGPCIQQHPYLNKLATENAGNKSYAIAGVTISSRKADWDRHLKAKPFAYQQYWLDEKQGGQLAEKLRLYGVPRYLLLRTADSVIVEKDIDFDDLEKTLQMYRDQQQ
ncbi:Thiol-disulfide isomerase or thioredoxin [Chitinophaga eiseniae]|uniref:Thiol-disulfide isomerase or thioredoxin n=1 Tax=Chitinophaga eiseniae TaxID=634771 RepID=A0A1T4SYH7_9BACT|nr:TlpA disulfide reductase family protein [Chitinophaga eiseniae]SKA33314.1 Thiol-disulfide isomerase or thioredoxin [Chitinophaga eiseniae]